MLTGFTDSVYLIIDNNVFAHLIEIQTLVKAIVAKRCIWSAEFILC